MKNNYYDLNMLSERIDGLRNDVKGKKDTQIELSKKIEEKTGVSISNTTLGKFENTKDLSGIKLINLIAIANYYEVSLDYLLGKTESKNPNITDQLISNKLSLSDESIKKLSLLSKNKLNDDNAFKIKLINFILENDSFLTELADKLVAFYKASDDTNKQIIDAKKIEYIARYDLINTFERFRDNTKQELWESKNSNLLFDMPIKKINKKEK